MRTIHLYGKLAKHVKSIALEVETAAEAIRALSVNFPSIVADIRDGSWHVVRGDKERGLYLGEEDVLGLQLGSADLHIFPAIRGRKNRGGILKVVLGIALIAVSFGTATFLSAPIMGGTLAVGNAVGMAGVALVLSGVSSMLAPENKSNKEENSFLMSGPTGNVGQGFPVPLVYGGPIIVGSTMISGGLDIDQLKAI